MENTPPDATSWRTPATPDPWKTGAAQEPVRDSGRRYPPDTFGPGLRAARERRGVGLRQAAKLAGISPGYLCLLEQGKRSPSESVAGELVRALHLTGQDALEVYGAAVSDAGRDYIEKW